MASGICPVCSNNSISNHGFCTTCGARIGERKRSHTPESASKQNAPSVLDIVPACVVDELPFPMKLFLFWRIGEGKTKLTFCSCARCNLLYREIVAELVSIETKKDVFASDPEIVEKANNKDLPKIVIDFSSSPLSDSARRIGDETPSVVSDRASVFERVVEPKH